MAVRHVRRPLDARGQDVEEGRPLQALHYVKVNNVDSVAAVEGFEDGLVGGEVGELDEGRDGVEDLERGVDALVVDEGQANAEPRVDDPARHRLGEVGDDSLGA